MSADSESFRDLLAAARRGDSNAGERLVERLYPRVQGLVHRALELDFRKNNEWVASLFSTGDVVHEILTELFRVLEGFHDDDEEVLATYLSRVIRNRLIDAVRFHRAERRDAHRSESLSEESHESRKEARGPMTLAALGEQVQAFREVLEHFSDKQSALLRARLVEQKNFPEIAEELGYATADAARKLYRDAHARLLVRLHSRGVRPPGMTEA